MVLEEAVGTDGQANDADSSADPVAEAVDSTVKDVADYHNQVHVNSEVDYAWMDDEGSVD